jgi:hypothetical protein
VSFGLGARRDSLAMAMVTAPASTASPASCPPMRRASSGTVAAAVAACRTARGLACGRVSDPVPGVGEAPTVGNRPDGSVGEMPVPEIVGSVPDVGSVMRGLVGLVVGLVTTTSVAESEKEAAPAADAFAEICTCSPSAALDRTCTVA